MDSRFLRPILIGVAFTSGLMLADACKSSEANSNHCSFLEGDATCADRYPGEFEHCGGDCVDSEHNDGCVAEVPVDCYYPCGGDMLAEDDMSCLGMTMTDTVASTMDSSGDPSGDPTTADDSSSVTMTMTGDETETDTDPTETTGPTDCQVSADCTDPNRPVCFDNDCVPCTETPDGDMACNAKDEALPVCRDDGHCVQCSASAAEQCDGDTPICDDEMSVCVACTYHEQCPESACRIATGGCFDTAEVYDVGPGEIYTTISGAHDDLGDGGEIVLLLHGNTNFDESLSLSGAGTAYAILRADGTAAWYNGGGGEPTVEVDSGAELYLQDVSLTLNADSVSLSIDDASLYMDRVSAMNNSNGTVVLAGGAEALIRSSFLGGGNFNDVIPLNVNESTAEIIYTSILGGTGTARALTCTTGSTVTIRNSLLAANTTSNPEINCDVAAVSYTATEIDIPGTGNVMLGEMMTNWFVAVNTNLRLTGLAPDEILSAAQWRTGDPAMDIDGAARPLVDGTADVAGAHIP